MNPCQVEKQVPDFCRFEFDNKTINLNSRGFSVESFNELNSQLSGILVDYKPKW